MHLLIDAAAFAAEKHRGQRRKDLAATPYINHPIGVARILAIEGGVEDEFVLAAALLHDTVEDTDTTFEEIDSRFGSTVGRIVREVTDDKSLDKAERKRLQIETAPSKSKEAKLVKLADKIYNLRDLSREAPVGWLDVVTLCSLFLGDADGMCAGRNSACTNISCGRGELPTDARGQTRLLRGSWRGCMEVNKLFDMDNSASLVAIVSVASAVAAAVLAASTCSRMRRSALEAALAGASALAVIASVALFLAARPLAGSPMPVIASIAAARAAAALTAITVVVHARAHFLLLMSASVKSTATFVAALCIGGLLCTYAVSLAAFAAQVHSATVVIFPAFVLFATLLVCVTVVAHLAFMPASAVQIFTLVDQFKALKSDLAIRAACLVSFEIVYLALVSALPGVVVDPVISVAAEIAAVPVDIFLSRLFLHKLTDTIALALVAPSAKVKQGLLMHAHDDVEVAESDGGGNAVGDTDHSLLLPEQRVDLSA
ncbi:Guanosine-3',5'-bis(diphosphate) 3'-pyrophosphohydrolase MESH1 [Entophlyctis luteolus]|nr:Guanosine-3',5'-bis(diphosphate) 3'-pyrophosphohydrolase MESH1 [Entophlyctis luteolus]